MVHAWEVMHGGRERIGQVSGRQKRGKAMSEMRLGEVLTLHRLRGGKLACLVVYCGPYHRTVELLWVWVLGPRVPVRSPVVLVCGLTR